MTHSSSAVALVTGAGHGIGRATVRKFRSTGSRVFAADIDLAAAQDLTTDPAALTSATEGSPLAQVGTTPASTVPPESVIMAASCTVSPTALAVSSAGATVIEWARAAGDGTPGTAIPAELV